MNQVIITLGANKPQIDHLNEELQALGASVIHYDDADRLLIDILHESVPDTENKDISSVIALIDFWPGRRSVVDFGIKVKSLLPHCRTAIASEYEAQDNLTKVETPPIDAVLRLPLQGCVACRLVYQTV